MRNHLLPEFENFIMNEITADQICALVRKKLDASYKASYCNRMITMLGACYNLAIKWNLIALSINPVKNVPLIKIQKKVERYLTRNESFDLMRELRRSPNELLKYFVPLALLTGARKRELLDVRWEDIDFENRTICFQITKSVRPRTVPLTSDAHTVLLKLKEEHYRAKEQQNERGREWVFPNPKTGKPFRSIFNSWNSARRRAGLPNLRIHDLRHSFASALVNQGVSLYDVQKLLGHQSIHTTERYAHLSNDRLRTSTNEADKYYSEALI